MTKQELIPSSPPVLQPVVLADGPRKAGPVVRPAAPTVALPDVADFFTALRRRWLSALVLGVAAMAAAAAVLWHVVPSKYKVRSLLYVASSKPSVLGGTSSYESRLDFANYQRTQAAIVKSRLVLNSALARTDVQNLDVIRTQSHPVGWLEKELKVDFALSPEILSITLGGSDAEEIQVLVNAIRDTYLNEVVEKERNDKLEQLARLKNLYAGYDELLKDRRKQLRELAQSVGSGDEQTLTRKQRNTLEHLATAQRELHQLQSELRRAEVAAATEGNPDPETLASLVPEAEVQERLNKDRQVELLQAEVNQLQETIQKARSASVAGDEDVSVRHYKAQLKTTEEALEQRLGELRPQVVAQLSTRAHREVLAAGMKRKREITAYRELEKVLRDEVARLEKEANSINRGSLDLGSIKEEVAQAEEVAKKVGAQIEAIRVELQAPARASVLEEAVVTNPEAPARKMQIVQLGTLGSFGLALFGLAWYDVRGRRLNRPEEVVAGAGVRVLGVLPRLPKAARSDARLPVAGTYRHDDWSESVTAARTMLLHAARDTGTRLVMVASALEGEGKTSLATHLAISLARKFSRVLLIDGDLRKASLHKRFDRAPGPGLCELVRGQARKEEVVQATGVPSLFLVSAGRCDEEAVHRLCPDALKQLFGEWKQEYDFIVVDSSPILQVADPLVLAQGVDAVIVSLLRDVSSLPAVAEACGRLSQIGVPVLGSIVHGVPTKTYGRKS